MDIDVWLQCQICFRCYEDRWDFRDHCRKYHKKTKTENIENGEITSSEGTSTADLTQLNSNNDTTGSTKPVIYRRNFKKVKTNDTVRVTTGPIDLKRGRGRPKGSTKLEKSEQSGVKPNLKTRIKNRKKKINYYLRNKFGKITLKQLASKVLIDNNMTEKLSPENRKMLEFQKPRGRPPTPKKGQGSNKFLQSIQKLKKRKNEPPKRYGDNIFENNDQEKKDDMENPDSENPGTLESPKRGRGRPRKLTTDFQPKTPSPSPTKTPTKSPIKMKIIRNVRNTPAFRNLGLRLGLTTRPQFYQYQAMLKGRSPQNIENPQSSLKSPSKNVKIHGEIAQQLPQFASENIANVSDRNSRAAQVVVNRENDGKFSKTKDSDTDTSTSTSTSTIDQNVKKKRGRPRKHALVEKTDEIEIFELATNATVTNLTNKEINENKTDDGIEIEKIRVKYSELTFEKVQVSSTASAVGTTKPSTSTNIVNKSPAFPAPDVQISLVGLKK